MEVITMAVFFLFRARLETDILEIVPVFSLPQDFLLRLSLPNPCSVYLTASTGETAPAIFPGFRELIHTVRSEKRAAPVKTDIPYHGDFKNVVDNEITLNIIRQSSDEHYGQNDHPQYG